MDGAELFNKCMAQATYVVKQVLPSHYANATPDAELDVEDLVNHMMTLLMGVPAVIGGDDEDVPIVANGSIDLDAIDLSSRWQAAADIAEAAIIDADLDDTIMYGSNEMSIEEYLQQISGDLLIHAWDLGEAIGMHVTIDASVAETVIETTDQRSLYSSVNVPANADLQTRLLALFGRSRQWRISS